ncbi:preprotein translocase subunit SecG [Lyticum sinuosum]|uniref:Protein-export membrane protein SecG n=1 Tax=Lyticum sinuosum TaxID=1332059 RepID=A0AAE5AHN7_9RICK|nr:preprotein translocase subunit SecG [Lyticum sinuosum]MDZ5760924.1 preprotein translocase subunit SecG [Lyticum sinuosum]
MENVLVIIQTIIVFVLIIIVLLQKPSGDTVASLGGETNLGAVGRQNIYSKIPVVVKITWFLVLIFLLNSMYIARVSYQKNIKSKILIEEIVTNNKLKDSQIENLKNQQINEDNNFLSKDEILSENKK